MIDKIIEWFPEDDILKADGFDTAIIGIDEQSMRLIYSVTKCIEVLMINMTEEDAIEYFNFNVKDAYIGNETPIWCNDEL